MFDESICKKAILNGDFEWRKHTIQRMAERNVMQDEVIEILEGEVIAKYDDDKPFPSALYLKFIDFRHLHVVVSIDIDASFAYIITVYEPNLDTFESDYKTKKKLL